MVSEGSVKSPHFLYGQAKNCVDLHVVDNITTVMYRGVSWSRRPESAEKATSGSTDTTDSDH